MNPTSLPDLPKPSRTLLNLRKPKFLEYFCLKKKKCLTTTPGSMNSLFTDQNLADFWPGFLALDQNGDGTDGRDGRDGRTEYSFTVLLGRRNTVLQYYLLFTI